MLTSTQPPRGPQFITDEIGKRLFVERLDVTDQAALLSIGKRHRITGIRKVIPGARFELPSGFDPHGPGRLFILDIGRLRADTGFAPEYDVERAVADYIGWLRAGNKE